MNERQAYALDALGHPINDPSDPSQMEPLRGIRRHGAGWLVMSILSIDR